MEIHNHGKNLKAHFPPKQAAPQPRSAPELAAGSDVAEANRSNPQRLLEQLESGEAVRKQLLVEIQAKIQAGEYQTRAAAVKAAEQIVGY